jgi:hypothetical protein
LHLRANEDLSIGTLVNHLNKLRLSSERASVPITDMAKVDDRRLARRIEQFLRDNPDAARRLDDIMSEEA